MKNAYSAKVASSKLFSDTNSISVLAVVKTENGNLVEDTFVSFYLPLNHPTAQSIRDGRVSEIGFHAEGFSEDPIRKGNPARDLKPVHALVGLDRRSVVSLLSTNVRRGTVVNNAEAVQRNRGLATRAAEWLKSTLTIQD
jgi:hypothetical protein